MKFRKLFSRAAPRVNAPIFLGCLSLSLLLSTPASAQEATESADSEVDGSEPLATDAPPETAESTADKKRSNARQLATDASNDYRMGRFEEAYDGFNRAFQLVGVPALGVWSARSLRQMGRLVEASERYREVLKKGVGPEATASDEKGLADARAELDELTPRIPRLTILLENAESGDVEIQMDGEQVDPALVGARQVTNPGVRKVVATRGDEVVTLDVPLQEAANETITLKFKPGYKAPAPAEAQSTTTVQQGFTPLETVGIVAMTGGVALLGTGIATTIIALGQQEDLRAACDNKSCPSSVEDDIDKFNTMKIVSTATLIGGAVLGGVGAALYFSGKKKSSPTSDVALFVRGTSLGVMGNF